MNIVDLIKKAVTDLPQEVEKAIREAYEREEGETARLQLKNILDNVKMAREKQVPMCQDTGLPLFFVRLGGEKTEDVERAIIDGMREATESIPLRPNVVDPLSRENTGDNTGIGIPQIYWSASDDGNTYITYLPKGAGSENASAMGMLKPSGNIKDFVLETIKKAGGKPCPPTIVGVGIGGAMDTAASLAKKALLRPIDGRNKNEAYAKLEDELLKEINGLGIGPMGLGGNTTALGVNIEYASCHTASLPVAVNIQCWAHRHHTMRWMK